MSAAQSWSVAETAARGVTRGLHHHSAVGCDVARLCLSARVSAIQTGWRWLMS